jgi:hypothetical protein
MKTVIVTFFLLFAMWGQSVIGQVGTLQPATSNQNQSDQTSKIKWVSTLVDMGEIPYNVPAKAVFEFSNISTEPVFIINVRSSCGCTVPDYSKEPILPQGTSSVTAVYNAKAQGPFQKTITVITNDNMEHKLTLKGKVVNNQ